jgi:hypothetical protein
MAVASAVLVALIGTVQLQSRWTRPSVEQLHTREEMWLVQCCGVWTGWLRVTDVALFHMDLPSIGQSLSGSFVSQPASAAAINKLLILCLTSDRLHMEFI